MRSALFTDSKTVQNKNIDIGRLAVNDSCQLGLFCIWFQNVSVNMDVDLGLHITFDHRHENDLNQCPSCLFQRLTHDCHFEAGCLVPAAIIVSQL